MAVVLVTGMSGTGKSTALELLARRGYRTVDTDLGGWIEEVPSAEGGPAEPLWREDRIDALITAHERSGEPLFLCGTVANQGRFYPRFAAVVLLSAPLEVMLDRISRRTANPFGKDPGERARITADTAQVEPLLRATATLEVDTRATPAAEVADRLAALVGRPDGHTIG